MIGIVVLNYNNYIKTMECVDSILKNVKINYRIYLIDNNSPNESFKKLKDRYGMEKKIEMMQSLENGGYAKGNNIAIRKAIDDGCDEILISNNDMIYYENSVEELHKQLKDNEAFIVAPRVMKTNGDIQISFKTDRYSFLEYLFRETYLSKFIKNKVIIPNTVQRVEWVAGCCFLANAQKFKNINLFDENTFLYFEEYILAEKARKANYVMLYCPESQVLHYHGQSIGNLNINATIAHYNSEMYYLKNYRNIGKIKLKILQCIRILEVFYSYGKAKKGQDIWKFLKNKGAKYE